MFIRFFFINRTEYVCLGDKTLKTMFVTLVISLIKTLITALQMFCVNSRMFVNG